MNLTGRPAVALPSELTTSAAGVVDPEGTACSESFSRTILPFYALCIGSLLCRLLAGILLAFGVGSEIEDQEIIAQINQWCGSGWDEKARRIQTNNQPTKRRLRLDG
jgi:hypothetical protein